MKIHNGNLTKLEPHQILVTEVVDSPYQGRSGQTYIIATWKYINRRQCKSLEITKQIMLLYAYAFENPTLEFMIPFNATGFSAGGYGPDALSKMFGFYQFIPPNIIFESQFSLLVLAALTMFSPDNQEKTTAEKIVALINEKALCKIIEDEMNKPINVEEEIRKIDEFMKRNPHLSKIENMQANLERSWARIKKAKDDGKW